MEMICEVVINKRCGDIVIVDVVVDLRFEYIYIHTHIIVHGYFEGNRGGQEPERNNGQLVLVTAP